MKKLIIAAFIGFSQLITAQVNKSLGDFTTVRAFDQITVTLVKSTENKIEIRGEKAGDVEVVNKNNDLKIRMKFTKLLQGEDVEATVYYKGNIDQVEASEGAFVSSADTFKGTAFKTDAKEGATVKLNLEVSKLNSNAASGGILELSGTATNHDVVLKSGAILKGKNLETSQTVIAINAGGEADVYATELVEAKTRAGGDIDIYGNPKQVNESKTAGGRINVIK
ncbi:chaperonin [Flavobacterium akiainvivens]|uniref:Chaperonin n=1 Tax=Flavobacterium akiainvivens TaxID=1202724 RepID=A0A0M9VIW4_9FLAO|nr:head GIN domain-containing protein [Flavobacterium akiainvivens]KOS07069.1 chaperonin [Flavobacterium akiainvivens]SFQ58543.1 Putative auto-transporter adhesin, head GIN domain [Flavobacterium akiainvivens]